MQRELLLYPNPMLRKKAKFISNFDETKLNQLIVDMMSVLNTYKGIGLAAPQIGLLEAVIVYKVGAREGYLINPVRLEVEDEGEQALQEECLSIPGLSVNVRRENYISVGYSDTDGSDKILHAEGSLSVYIQHEMDHLEGKLIVDHLSQLKRDIVTRKIKKYRRKKERYEKRFGVIHEQEITDKTE
jgi:peptide deformylase